MKIEVPLPIEFEELRGRVQFVQRKSDSEYCSNCPSCGGSIHENGAWSDRFCMWPVSKHGIPMGWCRKCSYIWTPSKERVPTKDEVEVWRKERETYHKDQIKFHQEAIEQLNSEKLWEHYHNLLDQRARSMWLQRGIGISWQDYWRLGINWEYKVNGAYLSPALSIPIWQADQTVSNIKLRITEPKNKNDRYRQVYKTGSSSLLITKPRMPMNGKCAVFEGEIKAMVMSQWLDTQVIGLPSSTPQESLLDELIEFEEITVCLDPDTFDNGQLDRVIEILGYKRIKVLKLPMKIDDALMVANVKPSQFLSQAIRL